MYLKKKSNDKNATHPLKKNQTKFCVRKLLTNPSGKRLSIFIIIATEWE